MKQQTNYLYCLTFPNGKKYIGKSVRPHQRLRQHCNPKSRIILVNRAIRKYGTPKFQILCAGDETYIAELEIAAIAALRTRELDCGYNVSLGGEFSPMLVPEIAAKFRGKARSPETRARMSAARKGVPQPKNRKPKSAEMRAKIKTYRTGQRWSDESKFRMRAAKLGKKHTPEARANMSAAKLGKKHSLETRARMSVASRAQWARRREAGAPSQGDGA